MNGNSDWIEIAKGIGIVLVVAGHFFPENSPYYWHEARALVYLFHMPLFFLLSGYLYEHGKYPYRKVVINKIHRLLYPFLFVAAIYFCIKYKAGRSAHLEFPVDLTSVTALLWDPARSFVPFLWFIHALLLIFLVYPLGRRYFGALAMLIVCLAGALLVEWRMPIVGKALVNAPYFALGVLLRESPRLFAGLIGSGRMQLWGAAAAFALGCIACLPGTDGFPDNSVVLLGLAVAGCILVIDSSVALERTPNRLSYLLYALGYSSMSIYLFHILFESSARVMFTRFSAGWARSFELTAIVSIAAGLAGPFLLDKYVLRRWQLTRKLVLGVSSKRSMLT